jgi:2-keto-4-pentenoate hydratase/2-oxohepta-3-ene-1,7-dioic acid hydratase in catechol pathway
MGISVVNYGGGDGATWGVLREGKVYPLQGQYPGHREVMASWFSNREQFESSIGDASLDPDTLEFNSPVTADVQLFCQGLNYADHRAESGASAAGDEENLVFMKAASSICAPDETILRPGGCELLDYEIELALVLREDISHAVEITEADLPRYVGGLVLCNDVSARDFMFGAPMLQWFRGKSQRTFCPMGPVLYLMDEDDFKYLYTLQLTLKLNGNVKQSASTDQLIHRPAETLAEISSFADLAAGDCLLTGTPGGILARGNMRAGLAVLLNFSNDEKRRRKFTQAQLAQSRFLEPGDVLELSIRTADGAIDLGSQRNEIADAG